MERRKLKIGCIEIDNPFILAPMAGYSDCAFRRLCALSGAGLTLTEMVSVKGLLYSGQKSAELLKTCNEEKVKCAQIFGANPQDFYDVITKTDYLDGFDIIDINMGCPVPKIVNNGEGSALIKDIPRAQEIVSACVSGAKGKPITVKTRKGFKQGENKSVEFCLAMQKAGVSAITVHGRTRADGYSGQNDFSIYSELKEELSVPLLLSGDADEHNANDLLNIADGVMIGRASVGNPWIFAKILGREVPLNITETLLKHIDFMNEIYGEHYTVVNMRKFIGGYYGGIRGNKEIKQECYQTKTVAELIDVIKKINA